MSAARLPADDSGPEPKRPKMHPQSILSFFEEDKIGTIQPHDDALVITLRIRGYDVKRVMVDDGSGAEIMYPDLYKGLRLRLEDLMPYSSPLMSFNGKIIVPKGQIRLPVQIGPEIVKVDFIVVDTYSLYTTIVAKPWLHTLGVVSSTLHQKVKFPSEGQVLEIRGCQATAREFLVVAISHRPRIESSVHVGESSWQSKTSASPINTPAKEAKCEDLEKVIIGNDLKRFFQVGSQLPPREKEGLIGFLRKNIDVFAWDAYDAPRIDPNFICHHLNVNPTATPKKQPPQRPSKEHANAISDEVRKLKQVGTINEVFYLEWLANTVVVKKKIGKWRVCVDFIDLNKASSKDPFPMPWIDQLVDATIGHPRISFLDSFQGYHQIPLTLSDQEKTTFMTPIGNYHYKVMPFGLKNAGSTNQRMMTGMFKP